MRLSRARLAKDKQANALNTPHTALGTPDLLPAIDVTLVNVLVDLSSTLDQVERSDEGVGGTASEDTTESTSGVELTRVEDDTAWLATGGVLRS